MGRPLMNCLYFGGLAALMVAVAGCAATPPPDEQLAVSQATLAKAEQAQAYNFAPVAFNTAQEKLSRARVAAEADQNLLALRLAEQAEVDADLAYYTARSAQAQRAVRQLQESIETLRRELEAGS